MNRFSARRMAIVITLPVLLIACGVFAGATIARDSARTQAPWLAVGVSAALCIGLLLAGTLLVRRASLRDRRRERDQQELRELLQVSASEDESQNLLIRHLQRTVPGSAAVVLHRNNSDDRLEVSMPDEAYATPLRDLATEQLRPRSCLAVRLSRSHAVNPGDQPLMRCEACGKIAGSVLCEPLLVGGQVIGSVLVTHDRPLTPAQREHVRLSVIQAAPILATQRYLTLAERRAASDELTGLPNRRAAEEAIKRMIAHAGRTLTPLSAVMLDLDRFQQVNDLHGYDRGDTVLAAIGQLIAGTIRASDFAARYGGEEFLLLLPDTDRGGAIEVAEKLRRTIERADIREVGRVTASFGVASLPDDAVEPEPLVHKADRALYAAKARGRNRVEVAMPAGGMVRDPRDLGPSGPPAGSDPPG